MLLKTNFTSVVESNLSQIESLMPQVMNLDQILLCLSNAVFGKCDTGAQTHISLGSSVMRLQEAYGRSLRTMWRFEDANVEPSMLVELGILNIIQSPVNDLMSIYNQITGFVKSIKAIESMITNPFACAMNIINEIKNLEIVLTMFQGFISCINTDAILALGEQYARQLLGQLIKEIFPC